MRCREGTIFAESRGRQYAVHSAAGGVNCVFYRIMGEVLRGARVEVRLDATRARIRAGDISGMS